jgi:hypothetical protein
VGDLLVSFTKDQDVLDEALPDALYYAGIYGAPLLLGFAPCPFVLLHVMAGVLWRLACGCGAFPDQERASQPQPLKAPALTPPHPDPPKA